MESDRDLLFHQTIRDADKFKRFEKLSKEKVKAIIYGSYLDKDVTPKGYDFLVKIRDGLRNMGYKNASLVSDLSGLLDYIYNISKIVESKEFDENIKRKVKNFLESIYSFRYGDFLIFVFTDEPLALHLTGTLIELAFYVATKEELQDKEALIMVEETLLKKRTKENKQKKTGIIGISSLFIGMLEYYKIPYRSFKGIKECIDQINSFIMGKLSGI